MNRYILSLFITAILYISATATVMYTLNNSVNLLSKQKRSEERVAFTVISKPKITPEKNKVIQQKPKQTTVKKVKEKVEKKLVKKVIKKPLSKPKKIVQVKKIIKKNVIKKKVTKKIKPVDLLKEEVLLAKTEESVQKLVEVVQPEVKKVTAPKTQIKQNLAREKEKIIAENERKMLLEKQRNLYFLKIKEMIAQNKVYPRIARKRGIEDDVKVKFIISDQGNFLEFKSIVCKSIFKKSVQKAIESTFPLKPQAGLFHENIDLSLTINYRLL